MPAPIPPELTNLRNVRTLPKVLALCLAILAIGALSHVLITSATRGRHEFAVLRALGLRRRDTRIVLHSEGTTIAIVGLLIGIPLGVAAGRVGWRLITDRVPLANVPPLALFALVVTIPLAVVLTNALALWPGHRVARVRPADALRTE